MTFTSYAQNFEDVLLHRALKGVQNGQYIDVGAADPELNSVTKTFYDRGWSGLNIEPVETLYDRLAELRPRDISLRVAVGDSNTPMTLFSVLEFDEISTTVPDLGHRYADEGRRVEESTVPGTTLQKVWSDNVRGEVHFLKIDVEGAELAVLKGADFAKQRPWIIVLEVVAFGTTSDSAQEIDSLLTKAGYARVFFDGLNRFYVADEHFEELSPSFEVPVNVTDDFRLPHASTAELALSRVAEALGATPDSAAREIIERTIAVVSDRVEFEKQSVALTEDLVELQQRCNELAAALETKQSLIEAAHQLSFERERHIAAVTAQVHVLRVSLNEERLSSQRERADIYGSSSWRASLPLRAIRHPARYLRRLFGR
jgi:FkbM family methyltransferase